MRGSHRHSSSGVVGTRIGTGLGRAMIGTGLSTAIGAMMIGAMSHNTASNTKVKTRAHVHPLFLVPRAAASWNISVS